MLRHLWVSFPSTLLLNDLPLHRIFVSISDCSRTVRHAGRAVAFIGMVNSANCCFHEVLMRGCCARSSVTRAWVVGLEEASLAPVSDLQRVMHQCPRLPER
jgi:hypothetical protein